jgi:rSAM/selenodomain-associated transferase 1
MSIAVGIFCKTPSAGASKTRLSPPLTLAECAALSACFIRDLSATINEVATAGDVVPYAIYTPSGSEDALRELLPPTFRLLLQAEGDFTVRVTAATRALLAGHDGAILVNADSPTLPASILRAAVDATRLGGVVLSPAQDGGYALIGVSALHEGLYRDIPWSTPEVYAATVVRAAEIGLPVTNVPGWYDVDDAASLAMLRAELASEPLGFTQIKGASAPATRAFLMTGRGAGPAGT